MSCDFLSPLSTVPGLGPRRVAALAESGIFSVGDLLRYFPHRYIDRATVVPLATAGEYLDKECTVRGTVTRARIERGRRPRLRVQIDDGSGKLEAVWFQGFTYLRDAVQPGTRLLLTGKLGKYATWQMIHPRLEVLGDDGDVGGEPYAPVYRVSLAMKRASIGQKTLTTAVNWALDHATCPASLPPRVEQAHAFPPLAECLRRVHHPLNMESLERYLDRLRYERMYTLALSVRIARRKFAGPGIAMRAGHLADRFERQLGFALTAGQRDAVAELLNDAASEHRMHRLLQGDVGCGKTAVAAYACLPALADGYQVAWMAPTEVLASQSFEQLKRWLEPLGFAPQLLTGSTAAGAKQSLLEQLSRGEARCVVGTHALLQPTVAFARLGMIVVDEQHRFGVEQRLELQRKGPHADFLLMSATPIPRTLAQSIYGDLDVVTVKGLPPGRTPVETHVVPEPRRADMERFVAQRIRDGGQAYYVVPRIEQRDEEEDDIADITSTFERLRKGAFGGIGTALVHGRLDSDEKERAVGGFAAGRVGLLIATSVVEVGIDAPGATVMVVENAERFGLSQLHQLRGRVGRNNRHAYCFLLVSPSADPASNERLKRFCATSDGFEIAELDLRLRGPGQMRGAGQSGWDDSEMKLVLENLATYQTVLADLEKSSPPHK
jgi:ATP-dependent DNA helicase RecG